MNLTKDRVSKINIKKLIIYVIALLMGIVSFGATTVTVEANTLLNPVKGGSVYRQYNANTSASHRYSYLLRGTTNSGYLPDVTNLQNYRSKGRYHTNKGWNINSPYRNDAPKGDGGLEMSHAVFGSKTYFHEVGGRTYLRISGTAAIPQYFHHTKANQQVAVMTREDGRNNQIKVWKATPINLTSSASYDYGYGEVYGQDNWRAVAKVGGRNYGIHTTNDPYPLVAETVDGVHGLSRYYDYGNINLLDSNYRSGINRNQVSKLAGLGIVGGRLMDTPGVNYVMDYTGFVVDIPVTALVSDPKRDHDYEFKIAKTMTTPNGHDARVYVQSLGMPTTKRVSTRVADAGTGAVGNVEFKPVSPTDVKYRPYYDALRNFKQTSNFVTEEFNRSTLGGRPSSGKIRDRSFSASSSSPRMIGIGANLMPKFGSNMWHELNRSSANVEHVEMRHHGRGDVWVGWRAPSIDSNRHVYTTAGIAYSEMPTAKMTYRPRNNFKPVVVRHVPIVDGMPQQPFKVETHSREKGVYGFTFKPLSASELRNYGDLRYTGNVRFGQDRTKPTEYIPSGGRWKSNEFLYLPENGGSNTLFVDIYYEGTPSLTTIPSETSLLLRERHRLTGTQSNIVGTSVDHRLGVGDSTSISRIRPYGYVYSGKYGVDEYNSSGGRTSSRVLNGTVHTVTNRREDENWTQWAMFYYDLRRYNYNVEHRNIETNTKIEHNTGGYITSTDPENPTRVTVRPLRGNDLPDGYTYANQYQDENGSRRVGSSYSLVYDDERNNVTVVFYYEWNEPEETTKRIQGDTTGAIKPADTYINAGVVTERDAQGVIGEEDLHATTSAIYDTYEAPIAVVPVQTTLNLYGEDGGLLTGASTSRNNNVRIYNDEFLNSLRVDSRIGSSADADVEEGSQTEIWLGQGTNTHTNVAMSTRDINSMEDLQEEAVGLSGASEEDREQDYVGRWLDANTDINSWTPLLTGNNSSVQTTTRDGNTVNDVARVEAEYEFEVYNRMRHNYEPRVGSDGLEYYEYTGTDFLRGYYEYDGDTRGRFVNSLSVIDKSELNVSDIVTDEYIDAEGFNVGAGQIAPVQFKIASELFDDGGSNIVGYRAETIGTSQAINPIVRQSDTNYRVIPTTRDTRLDYYEEFAYVPYHIEDELLTQQAVPVGGRLVYVNPYDYMTFPTVSGNLPVMEQNGILATEIQSNVNNFNSSGVHDSELGFDPTHSGYYMSEVDNFEEFKNSIADVEEVNRNYMQEVLRSEKEHNPELLGEEYTRGYRAYNDNIRVIASRYSRVGSVESATNFNKRLPVTYIHNMREFMLDDVVAVGKDSGYPIVSNSETINEDYITRYTNDLGVAPSDSDKLITTNSGSIYLLPLERENGHKLSDEYYTRLFVNGIGISQFNLVDDDILTYKDGKYLFGTGDNTIYSGERKEVEVGGEDFNDEEHTINPTATPEERGYINGGRRSNNSELNDAVLDDE